MKAQHKCHVLKNFLPVVFLLKFAGDENVLFSRTLFWNTFFSNWTFSNFIAHIFVQDSSMNQPKGAEARPSTSTERLTFSIIICL